MEAASIRPVQRVLDKYPGLGRVKVGEGRLGALLDRQLAFGIVGSGPISQRQLVPQSDAARSFLAGADGNRLEQVLRGSLSTLDGRKGIELDGITLSTSRNGFAAAQVADDIDARADAFLSKRATRAEHVRAFSRAGVALSGMSGLYDELSRRASLGPTESRALLAAAQDGRSARSRATQFSQYVLSHELEHAVTPPGARLRDKQVWLEEGTAELLSLQQLAADSRARAAGLPERSITAERERWLSSYRPYYRNLRDVLLLGGISPSSKDGLAQAQQLLQGGQLSRVPGKLARAIIQHNKLPDSAYEPIRQSIIDLGEKNATTAALTRLTRTLAAAT